ncbi:hypothetical protein RhiirA5_361871 [Rhizophagus irregularis]|uniref:Uncharacterized protein n=1 Tax=Rhizophagus irregularis TaxID=588596 RepID=A0A2I1ECD8_9GLOM|nr:hypothetical protein RhiirA5_361871 [Rhizophagus irregularis]PKY19783.1 hypothetical protein RhiirB3_407330 [Rhizophagus irregularis]
MATYKQKLPRVQHIERDSEESEQEWVVFNASNKPIERRVVNNVSDDDDWHVLSDASYVEEGSIPTFESNSELASGGSDYDSEQYIAQDDTRSVESFIRKMPSHDGTGNFLNATLSDRPNHELSTNLEDSNLELRRHTSNYLDQDNESSSRDINIRHANSPNPMERNSHKSWMDKFRNVFRGEEDVTTTVSQEQTTRSSQQVYHKLAVSASTAANFELGDLGNTNPIKALANIGNENANSTTSTTVTTHYVDALTNQSSQANQSASSSTGVDGSRAEKHASIITRFNSRLIIQKDPMAINFSPTISKDMINEMITENVNSVDHQKQQQTSSQSDKNSILSTVWTTFRRLTNNIIISDDTDSVPNDFANLAFTSSSHNTGLASIITGENHYDTCYLPFGNHLTLSELCPPLHSYKSHSHYSSPSTSSYNKRRNSITTSSNTARIFLTPVSSSTSLKSFTSRAGSDCGLESGRGIGRSTISEVPLVV